MIQATTCVFCGSRLPAGAARDVCDTCVTIRATVSSAAAKTCLDCGAPLPPGPGREVCPICVTRKSGPPAAVAEASTPSKAGPPPLKDYEILGEIARGGAGVIYKARQKSLNRIVALKMILSGELASPEAIQRFRVEAEAAASLDHPNIVPIYEVGEENGQHFFSMKLIDGEILSRRVKSRPLTPEASAKLVAVVARAIHFGHQKGILHRDLKPSNLLVTEDLTPFVVDFGLAKRVEGGGEQLTKTGDIMGTPSYMAPEQMEGKTSFTAAVDVYGLGGILYELLTGKPPFQGDSMATIMRKVLEEDPEAPRLIRPELDTDLETICLKCLEKDPRKRYASAERLAEDLERRLAGEPILARPITTWTVGVKWARRRPAAAGLIAVTTLALFTMSIGGILFSIATEKARRAAVAAEQEFELALTRDIAGRLESDLQRMSIFPALLSDSFARGQVWTQADLVAWAGDVLKRDPEIYGLCVAFEPFAFDRARENVALYISRKTKPPSARLLVPPEYSLYRDWDWYRLPMRQGSGLWDGPYVDVGGGDVPMVTYGLPILRDGKPIGIATVDLSLDYFKVIRRWLDELRLTSAYCFVLGDDGEFVSHPDAKYEISKKISEQPGMEAVSQLIARKTVGSTEAVDFHTGRRARFCVSPIPSADWTVVIVIPAEDDGP